MTNKIRIVAAILDTEKLVLYKEDGHTVEVKQGDPRVQRIIDEATGPLSTQGWADVSLDVLDPETNVYRDFQNLVKGAIRFFRVHKDKISDLFDTFVETTADNGAYGQDRHLTPVTLGVVPSTPGSMSADEVARQEETVSAITPIAEAVTESDEPNMQAPAAGDVADATENQKPSIQEATRQIMSQATPVTDKNFTTLETTEADTMIAAVEDPTTGEVTIVPGMEHLQAQFAHAVKLGSTEGATNFVKRLAAVINQRKHTIDELLNFMSKGDLPIADDGSIVAYKVLQSSGSQGKGYFVDCHSKKVNQRVGSYVTQANVDENRRTECSQGLHIARRGYLGGFSGDVIVLVKVAPEDVIAVPFNEPNKMRARGYHILSVIPSEEHSKLRSNGPIEGSEARKLLNMALRGQHIDIIEEVHIGGPKGTDVTVKPREKEQVAVPKAPRPNKRTAEAETVNTDDKRATAPKVDVGVVSEKVVETKQTEQRSLFVQGQFKELYALKKAKKKSWTQLGFSDIEVQEILAADPTSAPIVAAPPVEIEKTGTKKKATPAKAPAAPAAPTKEPSRQEKAKALLHTIDKGKTKDIRRQAYQDLIALKKASKVGWGQLGVENFDAIQAKFEGK